MFKLLVVVIFLFSIVSLNIEAAELEMEPANPEESLDMMQPDSVITPRPEIDPEPLLNAPGEDKGGIPVPIPQPVDEHGVAIDPEPIFNTPGEEEGAMPIPLPEPAGERHHIEDDPIPFD